MLARRWRLLSLGLSLPPSEKVAFLSRKAPFVFLVFPGNNSTPDFPDNIEKFPDNTRINVRKRTNQIARFESADTNLGLCTKMNEK